MNDVDRLKYGGLLREGLWFGGLPRDLQDGILDRAAVRRYARRAVIHTQGAPPEALFAVLEGQVAIQRWANLEQPALVDIACRGAWFGELPLLLHSKVASVTTAVEAAARTDTKVLALPLRAYEALIERSPDDYRRFARLALERYDAFLRYATESRVLAAGERLLARLADLAHTRHQERPAAKTIVLELTQADIAALTGLSRQTVNAQLHRLAEHGLIELSFRRILIFDLARLGVARESTFSRRPADRRAAGVW
jgi:CRP-like cAMP-binding protein